MKNRSKFLTSTLLAAAAMSFCTTSANAADLTWEGIDDNNSWDGVSNNWSGDSKFSSGDSATSDDTAESSEEVPIEEEEITAGTIEIGSVDGTGGETTFGGSGSITIFATYSDVMWLTTTYDEDVYVTSYTMEISDGETIFEKGVYVGGGSMGEEGSIKITGGTTTFKDSVSVAGGSMGAYGSLTIDGGETTFEGSVSVSGSNSMSGDGSITIAGGTTTFSNSVSVFGGGFTGGNASLTIDGGTTTFKGRVSVSGGNSTDGSITITGGETTFEGSVSVSGRGSGILATRAGSLSLTGGTITLYYAISNSGTVTVTNNVVFVLDNLTATSDGTTNTYTLISGDGTISGWDSLSASNFSLDGKGLGRSTVNVETKGQVTITFVAAADLVWNGTDTDNVWTNNGNEIWLNDGSTADAFVQNDSVTFGSDGTKSVSIVDEIEAGSVTVTGNGYTFTFSEDNSSLTADSLTIAYGASLEITNGETTITSVEISSGGSLTISGEGTTTFEGAVTVGASSLLELTGGTITLSEAISNSGTVTVSDNVVFVLDNLGDGGTYTLISGGTIENWNTLTNSNFLLNGSTLKHSSLDLSTEGQVTIKTVGLDLVWNGTEDFSVWTNDGEEIWLNGEEQDMFIAGDNVTFGSDGTKSVSIVGKIEAGSVTVTGSGYTFTFSEDSSITADNSLTISSGASLKITGAGTFTTTFSSSSTIDGDLTISGGSTTFSSYVDLGYNSGSSGSLTISNSETTFGGGVSVGNNGTGTMEITGGKTTFSSYVHIGCNSTSSSSLTISGGKTMFSGQVSVGNGGIGSLTITDGDTTFSSDVYVGYSNEGYYGNGSLTITGGETTFSSFVYIGRNDGSSGTMEIIGGTTTFKGDVEVGNGGTGSLTISSGTTTFEGTVTVGASSSLELTGGTLNAGSLTIAEGATVTLSGGNLNVGSLSAAALTFGDDLTVGIYGEATSLTINSAITLTGTENGTTFYAGDSESITLSGTISGDGNLTKTGDGTLTVSSDNNTYSGGTTISSGTIVAQSENALGTGAVAIDDGATLELAASGTFSNATSGNGTLSITNGATVSFGSNVGVKNVNVASEATLSGGATLTSSGATLDLAGTLALDASAGEQVSFTNGGTVILEDSATLTLSGISAVSPANVKPLAADTEEIGPGSSITIFSGATIEGDIKAFLATDTTLSALADTYAVVYDPNKGLTVTILESGNVSSLTSGVKLHDGIGSDFISAIISDEDFGTGFENADELNPIVRALVTGNISEASKMFDTLAPNDYAAMVAMPTTSFYNDVKAIDNRLAARRGPIDENARWEFFAQAQGTFIENDDASDTQTFDFDLYGVLAGADYRVNEGLTVGVTVGYDYGKADIHNSGGKIESDDVRITLFAGQQIGEMFFVNAGAQVGYGHYEAKRKTAYGNANGDTDGWNAGVFADVGMMLTLSEELKISARPYVGLAYLHSEVGSFDDNIFDVDDFHGDSLRASIGCGLFWGFDLAEAAWAVGLDASYSHDFCGDEVDIDATCMSTDKDFGITAKALSKDLFSVGPVVSVGLTKSIDIFAGYAFQAGTDSSTGHNVNAGLKVTF